MAHARLGDHRAAVADAREALRLGKVTPRWSPTTPRGSTPWQPRSPLPTSARRAGQARPISSHYQDIAVQLIREAFEQESPAKRAAFWQDAIQPDPALKAIGGGSTTKS